jgi:hypothetical protein
VKDPADDKAPRRGKAENLPPQDELIGHIQ